MDVANMSASFFQAASNYDGISEAEGFPPSSEDIWILGANYKLSTDRDALEKDVQSRIFLTYRKGFGAIGGNGPTSDFGWGCMLRCGQMILAEALLRRHLSRAWRWIPQSLDMTYLQILQLFIDRRDCCYSIHQIASMGVSEGKAVGEWFGPNTVTQVLRKLAVYDRWSDIVVHVAMDNCIITDDIYRLCASSPYNTVKCPTANESHNVTAADGDSVCLSACTTVEKSSRSEWQPLMLVIPMRLGLSDVNSIYFNAVKQCFTLPQSIGIIGGKPNNAYWFIGYTENKLFYLDPHKVQPFADFTADVEATDESYHSVNPSYVNISQLDPSIAIGFYCGSRTEFDQLCRSLRSVTVDDLRRSPLLEVHEQRPSHFLPAQPYSPHVTTAAAMADFTLVDEPPRVMDSDDEFEILL